MRPTTKLGAMPVKVACGRCGRLGHRAPGCVRPARAIDKIGVEVEGWWTDLRAARRAADDLGCSGAHDGSLARDDSNETEAWEFRVGPGPLSLIRKGVHALYPDKYDATAGLHIHVSLVNVTDVALLASQEFFAYALGRWRAWGDRESVNPGSQFWKRLRGENRFCLPVTDNDLARLTRGDRYRWLNFTAWERHKTVELRLLPLFGSEALTHSAITEWCAIVEDWLAGDAVTTLAPVRAEINLTLDAAAPDVWAREIEVPAPDAPDAPVVGEVTTYAVPALVEGATRTTANVAMRTLRSILEAA